jgi:uncharacterized protein (TIGR00730 family)
MDQTGAAPPANIRRVTVYASSSNALADVYYDAARRLGRTLGQAGLSISYGGGGVGLMRETVNEAMAYGSLVRGVIPGFMNTVEHGHRGLHELEVVDDIRERKHRMLHGSDAVVSLPGGSGTLEELFEVLTLKRLGKFTGPVVLVNTAGYYERFVDILNHAVSQNFMAPRHLDMWEIAEEPEEVVEAMRRSAQWDSAAFKFAAVPAQSGGGKQDRP